jgi:hypothetical protein
MSLKEALDSPRFDWEQEAIQNGKLIRVTLIKADSEPVIVFAGVEDILIRSQDIFLGTTREKVDYFVRPDRLMELDLTTRNTGSLEVPQARGAQWTSGKVALTRQRTK